MKRISARERLIFPIDVSTAEEATRLIDELYDFVGMFKIGFQLIHADLAGKVSAYLRAKGGLEFRDAKLKDTPGTMEGAAKAIASRGTFAFNIHVDGDVGVDDVKRINAVKGSSRLWCVTLLTSVDEVKCRNFYNAPPMKIVAERANRAQRGGADGIICSPQEVRGLRMAGITIDLVTPGVRPAGADAGQQARFTTPGEAISLGSDYLVCGSPIRKADNPRSAAEVIVEEMQQAFDERYKDDD